MSKDLIFIQVCPSDTYYVWQTHMWLESLKNIGKSDKAICLIFVPKDRKDKPNSEKWDKLKEFYPESTFFIQHDEDNITSLLSYYIPLLRPYTLSKYFKLHPELKEKSIFYCDSDILFLDNFNIDKYIDDEICYLSNTNSYINADYFDRKINQVIPNKLELYKKRDILNEACKIVGISREVAIKNNLNSGGAQYLLKNIDYNFWEKVLSDCISIKKYLQVINRNFFVSENVGIQTWCADMWAVLWNLWWSNHETRIIPEMSFSWSSDPTERLKENPIFHNAGIVGEKQGSSQTFFKGKYNQEWLHPFKDGELDRIINSDNYGTLANHFYVSKMIELSQKYDMNYLNKLKTNII